MARRKESPQKAAMREMMKGYLKENDISIKDGSGSLFLLESYNYPFFPFECNSSYLRVLVFFTRIKTQSTTFICLFFYNFIRFAVAPLHRLTLIFFISKCHFKQFVCNFLIHLSVLRK